MSRPWLNSIRGRLLTLAASISVLTLAVTGSLFVVNDALMLRRQMVRDLEVLSVVVGDSCLSALAFEAPETAEENLRSLRREYQVRYAALFDAEGRLFASYRRDAEQPARAPRRDADGVYVSGVPLGLGTVEVVRTLRIDTRRVGRLFIHARTDELAQQMRRYAGIAALLLTVSLAASLLLGWRLQQRVSRPILDLAATARDVSERGDYSVRAMPADPARAQPEELRTLYRGFNTMLEQIQQRDAALTEIRDRLEQLVQVRTRELDRLLREQRLIVESMPLGIIHLVGRRIVRANPRAAELFGTRPQDMIGRVTEEYYPDRAGFDAVGEAAYPRMRAGEIYREDRLLRRSDGGRFWGRLIGQFIDPREQSLGSIWIIDDISRDKAMEDQLRQARETAEAASRAKDVFMANMSHELRTPLSSVLGFAQILEQDPGLDARQREQVQNIRRGSERLLGLIAELLDLARIEAGRVELSAEPADIRALLDELASAFGAKARAKGLRLRVRVSADLPARLLCDHKRLHQVISNLIDNAIKFTAEGEVSVSASHGVDGLVLDVRDSGIGIASDELARVFERFGQAKGAGTAAGGVGLGLAISERLVRCMGGSISVESAPGAGSRFIVRIPAEPVVDDQPVSPEMRFDRVTGYQRTDDGHGPLRILVVDDEAPNRGVIRGMLQPLGFSLHEAVNGRDCLDRCADSRPDLILMDMRMPVLDGIEATQAVRATDAAHRIPVVAVTAAAFIEDIARAMDAGCDAHLAKPLMRSELLRTLAALLPLRWVHGQAQGDDAAESSALEREGLPRGERAALAQAVRRGDVGAVAALATELAQRGCCPKLVARLARLAARYDIVGLRALLADLDVESERDKPEP